MYVYVKSEPGLWTVGFYDPKGKWVAESDHDNPRDAAERVAWLNGSRPSMPDSVQRSLNSGNGSYRP